MRGISLDKMPVEQLREAVSVMSRRGGGSFEPRDLKKWSRERCVKWLETIGPPSGIGNFCRALLRVVTGKTEEGNFPIGLSYSRMVDIIKVHYPNSMADYKHLRWYATSMRAAGEMIPVYREKSQWKDKKSKNSKRRMGDE